MYLQVLTSCLTLYADTVPKGGEHAGKLRVEDFLEIKKTQLKGAKAEAVTDKKKVHGQHSDGAPLVCSVQGMDKHGDGLRQASLSSTEFSAACCSMHCIVFTISLSFVSCSCCCDQTLVNLFGCVLHCLKADATTPEDHNPS